MQTELNKAVINFFKLPIEKITYEEIIKRFNKKDKNEYGNLLHASVQNRFDERKVLKFINLLLENGYNVNYKGERTGYNFIQLALYGYTDKDGEDHSYSQEFIVKLIALARKYNLDVNTKDDDGDSIVHTALASEVYTGKIIPIIDALGEEFDISCTDNNDNSLKAAFELYKEEARNTNKSWFSRLSKEEQELKCKLEIGNVTLEDITKQEEIIRKELENLIDKIDVNFLIENKEEIFKLKHKLNDVLTKKSLLTNKENTFTKIWNKYDNLLKKVFSIEIKRLSKQNNIEELNKLIDTLKDYDFVKEQELIKNIIEEYKVKVAELESKIKTELTIEKKEEFANEISTLNNPDKENLTKDLENFADKLLSLITEITNQEDLLRKIGIEVNIVEYKKLTNKELKVILEQNKKLMLSKKKNILNEKKVKLEAVIKEILDLENLGIFESDELWSVIKSSTTKKNKVKKK